MKKYVVDTFSISILVNHIPPTVIVAINASHTSLNITWMPYERSYWNGEFLLNYIVYFQEVTSDLTYNMTLYANNVTLDNETFSVLLTDLKPFTNYSMFVTTSNEIGIGYGQHVFCRTDAWRK